MMEPMYWSRVFSKSSELVKKMHPDAAFKQARNLVDEEIRMSKPQLGFICAVCNEIHYNKDLPCPKLTIK